MRGWFSLEAPGNNLFLSFPASGGAHIPWLTARPPPSQSSPESPVSLTLILLPPAYREPCGYIGPVWIIQAHPHLKVLNLTPSTKSVTIYGGIHRFWDRFWGLGHGRLCWGALFNTPQCIRHNTVTKHRKRLLSPDAQRSHNRPKDTLARKQRAASETRS